MLYALSRSELAGLQSASKQAEFTGAEMVIVSAVASAEVPPQPRAARGPGP